MEEYSRNLLDGKKGQEALKESGSNKSVLFFCEQNSPELMTLEEYLIDNVHAKIDQCDRLQWWTNRGYQKLGFEYIQPALREDTEPCYILTLNVKAGDCSVMPGNVVLTHLHRFFKTSIFKGDDPSADESYTKQKEYLEQHPQVALVREDFTVLKKGIERVLGRVMLGSDIENKPLQELLQ
jgi:hypothetical protein